MGCAVAIIVAWLLAWGTHAPCYVWLPVLVLLMFELPHGLGHWAEAIEQVAQKKKKP